MSEGLCYKCRTSRGGREESPETSTVSLSVTLPVSCKLEHKFKVHEVSFFNLIRKRRTYRDREGKWYHTKTVTDNEDW